MGNVMVIPARRQVGNTVKQSAQKKLRVAAYCRVSTDSEEQETSYEAQPLSPSGEPPPDPSKRGT